MQVTLLERVPLPNSSPAYVVVARGTVDGKAAGKFVRSFISETVTAECKDGWKEWRWHLRVNGGRRQVNKVPIYR